MKHLIFSEYESRYLGLNIFRAEINKDINYELLKQEINTSSFRIIRFKVEQSQFLNFQSEMKFKKKFYKNSVYGFKADYTQPLPGKHRKGIEFIKCNEKMENIFYDLLIRSIDDFPLGYANIPGISEIISKEKEKECYANYFKKYYCSSGDKEKSAWLLKDKEEYLGGFVFEENKNFIDTGIAFVRQESREQNYFKEMIRFRHEYAFQKKISTGINGGRIENPAAIHLYLSNNFIPVNLFHIFIAVGDDIPKII